MAFMTCKHELIFKLVLAFAIFHMAIAGDADIISDLIVPPNVTNVDGNFFTYTGMRAIVRAAPPTTFKVLKASMAEFPALNGQSVSYAVLQYPAGSVNPPHTHPRSAELLFLVYGSLEVKLDLLTRQTSSLLRSSKSVTCLFFQKDLFTTSTIVMQRILQ